MDSRQQVELRNAVRTAYSAAAENPGGTHPFPVGRAFAESLGYPAGALDALPAATVEAFAGVSNVGIFADLPSGATVLDLGCGSGLDSLIAAQRVGETGRVVGIDFSSAMLGRARRAAVALKAQNLLFGKASAEALPLRSSAIDVATVNGIFNLNPARTAIFAELARVVRPGGAVYAAELILREALPPEVERNPANWFA